MYEPNLLRFKSSIHAAMASAPAHETDEDNTNTVKQRHLLNHRVVRMADMLEHSPLQWVLRT